jgi:hypothetical protein
LSLACAFRLGIATKLRLKTIKAILTRLFIGGLLSVLKRCCCNA